MIFGRRREANPDLTAADDGTRHTPSGAVVTSDGRDGIVYRLGDRRWSTGIERNHPAVAVWAGPASHWDDGTVLTSAELETALDVVVAVLHQDGYDEVDVVRPDRQEKR